MTGRIRVHPAPGIAKEKHVIEIHDRENRLCELVDGVLVEKVIGAPESLIAMAVGREIGDCIETEDLGVVLGADGMTRFAA